MSRRLLGLVGAPGAGKSTYAAQLVEQARADGTLAVVVPLDGFHLADATLATAGMLDRKGAPETFDPHGYVALLRRLRTDTEHTVYVPGFERDLEQPVAGAIPVPPEVELVVTEGNYLLLDAPGWREVRGCLDEMIAVLPPSEQVRRERLVARHVLFGKSHEAAREWVEAVDEPNARLVAATLGRADRSVRPG